MDNPSLSPVIPSNAFWRTEVPPKVWVLAQMVTHVRVTACYKVQGIKTPHCLLP